MSKPKIKRVPPAKKTVASEVVEILGNNNLADCLREETPKPVSRVNGKIIVPAGVQSDFDEKLFIQKIKDVLIMANASFFFIQKDLDLFNKKAEILGKSGPITSLLKDLAGVPESKRREMGNLINDAVLKIKETFKNRLKEITMDKIDFTKTSTSDVDKDLKNILNERDKFVKDINKDKAVATSGDYSIPDDLIKEANLMKELAKKEATKNLMREFVDGIKIKKEEKADEIDIAEDEVLNLTKELWTAKRKLINATKKLELLYKKAETNNTELKIRVIKDKNIDIKNLRNQLDQMFEGKIF
jgi:hypothetical protein